MMNKGATKLKAYYENKGLSQAALARELGVTQPYLSKLLNGHVTPGGLFAFKVSKIIKSIKTGDWWEEA